MRSDLSPKPAYTALRKVIAGSTAKLRPRLFLSSRIWEARVPVARASKRPPSKRVVSKRQARKRKAMKRKALKRIALKRRSVNRVTISGNLTLPGTPWPNTLITVLLPRRGAPPRAMPVVVKEGYFWARFDGRDLRSGTIEARYGGSDAYQPLTAQVQVVGSATSSR